MPLKTAPFNFKVYHESARYIVAQVYDPNVAQQYLESQLISVPSDADPNVNATKFKSPPDPLPWQWDARNKNQFGLLVAQSLANTVPNEYVVEFLREIGFFGDVPADVAPPEVQESIEEQELENIGTTFRDHIQLYYENMSDLFKTIAGQDDRFSEGIQKALSDENRFAFFAYYPEYAEGITDVPKAQNSRHARKVGKDLAKLDQDVVDTLDSELTEAIFSIQSGTPQDFDLNNLNPDDLTDVEKYIYETMQNIKGQVYETHRERSMSEFEDKFDKPIDFGEESRVVPGETKEEIIESNKRRIELLRDTIKTPTQKVSEFTGEVADWWRNYAMTKTLFGRPAESGLTPRKQKEFLAYADVLDFYGNFMADSLAELVNVDSLQSAESEKGKLSFKSPGARALFTPVYEHVPNPSDPSTTTKMIVDFKMPSLWKAVKHGDFYKNLDDFFAAKEAILRLEGTADNSQIASAVSDRFDLPMIDEGVIDSTVFAGQEGLNVLRGLRDKGTLITNMPWRIGTAMPGIWDIATRDRDKYTPNIIEDFFGLVGKHASFTEPFKLDENKEVRWVPKKIKTRDPDTGEPVEVPQVIEGKQVLTPHMHPLGATVRQTPSGEPMTYAQMYYEAMGKAFPEQYLKALQESGKLGEATGTRTEEGQFVKQRLRQRRGRPEMVAAQMARTIYASACKRYRQLSEMRRKLNSLRIPGIKKAGSDKMGQKIINQEIRSLLWQTRAKIAQVLQ